MTVEENCSGRLDACDVLYIYRGKLTYFGAILSRKAPILELMDIAISRSEQTA